MVGLVLVDPETAGAGDPVAEVLNERHVPVFAGLLEELAETGRRGRVATGLRARLVERFGEALEAGVDVARMRLWSLAPWDAVIDRVVEPLLRAAAEEVGELRLAAPGGSTDAAAHRAWQRDLAAAFERRVAEPEAMGRDFWLIAAAGVWSGAVHAQRHLRRAAHQPGLPPEPDPVLVRMLFTLDPARPDARHARLLQARAQRNARERSSVRPREGGIAGIRHSTAMEDFHDALTTELAVPPPVLLGKLTGDGLLVRHRPPHRRPERDLLVIGLAPDAGATSARLPAQASWTDAMVRLWPVLAGIGLTRTDIAWAARVAGGLQLAAMRLDRLPEAPAAGAGASERRRRAMLLDSGLLPGIVDRLPGRMVAEIADADLIPAALDAVANHLPPRGRTDDAAPDPRATSPHDYAAVHLCLFERWPVLDDGEEIVDWGAEPIRIATRFGLQDHPRLMVTWVRFPGHADEGYRADSGRGRDPLAIQAASLDGRAPAERTAAVIGQLSAFLAEQTIRASDEG